MTRIDTALGRVSMYRLVFAALAVVLGWAVIAAAFGLTGFSASGILLTTAAALAGVLLGTVGGLLFMRKSAPGPSSPPTLRRLPQPWHARRRAWRSLPRPSRG